MYVEIGACTKMCVFWEEDETSKRAHKFTRHHIGAGFDELGISEKLAQFRPAFEDIVMFGNTAVQAKKTAAKKRKAATIDSDQDIFIPSLTFTD
jgi:hypothetical protein